MIWAIREGSPSLLPGQCYEAGCFHSLHYLRNLGEHSGESLPVAEMAGVHQSSISPPIPRRQDCRAVSGWGLAARRGHITGLHRCKVGGSGTGYMQFKLFRG